MSNKDYERGKRDGERLDYKPPVEERIFTQYTPEEKEKLDDYDQGYRHGREDRDKKR
jgi:hypothetical protein